MYLHIHIDIYVEYLVRWKDQATSHDTWELESGMERDGPELIRPTGGGLLARNAQLERGVM